MESRIPLSAYVVSAILLLYALLIAFGAPLSLVSLIFSVSPLLVIWMVISVLKSKSFTGRDLRDGEEWGYDDSNKDDPGTF